MVKVVHFDASGPSAERVFAEVGKQVEALSSRPEMKDAPHETIVKETLRSMAERLPEQRETASPAPPTAPAPQPVPAQKGSAVSTLPGYLSAEGGDGEHAAERQAVEELVAQAFDKGLEDAIRAAKRCDPFIEDAFHDALTEQLIPELKRRGILK